MNRLPSLVRQHIAALRMLLAFTVLCGIVYPVLMWGVAQAAFKNQADGSLVTYNGKVVGSSLLCQEFVDAKGNPLPQYFQPRPSAASSSSVKNDYGCDPNYSGAANLGPNNTTLLKTVQQLQQQIAAFDHVPVSEIPPDAVTTSASGLDPDNLPESDPTKMSFASGSKKAWKDIWGSGQGVGAVDAVVPAAMLIDRLKREYAEARARLGLAVPASVAA